MKGKGLEPSFHGRRRQVMPGMRTTTRLTRTMGFVEVSQSTGVSGSIDASGTFDPDLPVIETTPH